ncbi:MAG: polysaccharide deacetylase family protein [Chloroflexi bacterium]|nr:polysaccharide deacetylase family protein [Chloroflexota bacterium]
MSVHAAVPSIGPEDTVELPSGVAVLMYHYVRPDDAPCRVGAGRVDLPTFASQLDDLARRRTVVGWPEVAAAIDGRATLPDDAVLLTFDDGHDDHHRYVLPMLAERGLTGVFFVMARDAREGLTVAHRIHVVLGTMGPAELRARLLDELDIDARARFLAAETAHGHAFDDEVDDLKWVLQRDSIDDVGPMLSRLVEELAGPEIEVAEALHLDARQTRELHAAGMTLGGHTHGHRWLDHVSVADARAEIGASVAQLSALAPGGAWPFAYPYGAPPADPGALLRPAGFRAAFVATGRSRTDRWRLGRVDAETLGPRPSERARPADVARPMSAAHPADAARAADAARPRDAARPADAR